MHSSKFIILTAFVIAPTFAGAYGVVPPKGHRTVAEHIATRNAMEAKQDKSAAIRKANAKKFEAKEDERMTEHKKEASEIARRDAVHQRTLKK